MLIHVHENRAIVDGVNYGLVSDAVANNAHIADAIAHAAQSAGSGFPLAIDCKPNSQVGAALCSLPLPPVPEGWTRLLASDYSEGDEWEDVPAVTEERTVPAVIRQVALLTDPPQYVDEVVTPERTDTVIITPAYRRQTASGVCKEYQRRAEEWAANRPANVRTYTQAEYDAATQAALDAHAQAHDFWNMAEAGQFAYPGNAFQAEAAALVEWAAKVWQARYAHTDSTVEPAAMVAAILAQHPAP